MFRCPCCQGLIGPGVSSRVVVVESRPVVYPKRPRANEFRWLNEQGRSVWVYTHDSGGVGVETVREVRVCPGCAARRAE